MTEQFSSRVSRYFPLLVWIAIISFASTANFSANNTSRIIEPLVKWLFPNVSAQSLGSIHFLTRKAAHFTEYFVLGYLAARAFRGSSHASLRNNWIIISVAVVGMYSLLDEFHQSFVPSRTSSLHDSLIDTIGGVAALAVVAWRTRVSRKAISTPRVV
ncbi:MAG: VanZ family protein [Pyrinomonadaceae bacterium]